jgi:hypothetical protein
LLVTACNFRLDHKDEEKCPKCGTDRYKYSARLKKRIPKQRMVYFGIIPLLCAIMACKPLAELMRYHTSATCEDGVMRDVYQGAAYEYLSNMEPKRSDPRHAYIGLVVDGFLVDKDKKVGTSVWPIIGTVELHVWRLFSLQPFWSSQELS